MPDDQTPASNPSPASLTSAPEASAPTSSDDASAIRERVRDQYERYPYPPPAAFGTRFVTAFGFLDYAQHVLWPGRSDLRGLRVLDAGCGTGHAAVSIARDHPEVEVVGIDLSQASLTAARAYAGELGVRGNLTLRRLAIEDAGQLEGQFDYVIASGVLHHLADPDAGLRALAGVLAPTGGLGVMVYATYGRRPIYMVQDLIARMAADESIEVRISLVRKLLDAWPGTHPFHAADWLDMDWQGDAGLVDLLLHSRDRSYTVPEVLALLDGAGLRLERFYDPLAYTPEAHTTDPDVAEAMASLPASERAAIAELLHGAMRKHMFFATHASYEPVHVAPRGLALMMMRPKRSPIFHWEGARPEGEHGALIVPRHAFDLSPAAAELNAWQVTVVGQCDGDRTAEAIFAAPDVYATIPGETSGEKLDAYGRFMEHMAAIGLLLFEL